MKVPATQTGLYYREEITMTTKKASLAAPATLTVNEFEAMRLTMIAKASTIPEVIATAKSIFAKSTKWAEKVGIGAPKKAISTKGKTVGKVFDDIYANGPVGNRGSNGFNGTQWYVLKELLEAVIGEPIECKALKSNTAKALHEVGTAIKIMTNKHDHCYPIGAVIFVTNPQELAGVLENGLTPPTGSAFDYEIQSVAMPTEAEITSALANMYIVNVQKFTELAAAAGLK
jgi:hypothetical protein